jgi:hypothetical protein
MAFSYPHSEATCAPAMAPAVGPEFAMRAA